MELPRHDSPTPSPDQYQTIGKTLWEVLYASIEAADLIEDPTEPDAVINGYISVWRKQKARINELTAKLAEAERERDRYKGALEAAHSQLKNAPELNSLNFSKDDALDLNHSVNQVCCDLEAALKLEPSQ